MIIKNTGKIIDDLYMVGTPAMPIYLLDGEKPAVFDAGLAFLGKIYIEYDPIQGPKQIESAYLLNLEAKVKAIKKRIQNS